MAYTVPLNSFCTCVHNTTTSINGVTYGDTIGCPLCSPQNWVLKDGCWYNRYNRYPDYSPVNPVVPAPPKPVRIRKIDWGD